jgi:hypothetical protein
MRMAAGTALVLAAVGVGGCTSDKATAPSTSVTARCGAGVTPVALTAGAYASYDPSTLNGCLASPARNITSVSFDRFLRQLARQPGAFAAVGAHVAIYVDTLAPTGGLSSSDIDTLQQTFDTHVYAVDTTAFGRESDIDSNSVVIALLTPAVNALVTKAQCDSSGYITGFFYPPDLDPIFSSQYNHGEIFYAIVPDPLGTLSCVHTVAGVKRGLPPTFLHEFEHMISYNQHVLVAGSAPEEDWLDEGLAKYAEELGGRSWLPGDSAAFSNYAIGDVYDASQYLTAPDRHFVLTTSDQRLADVGAGWLFVRYLVDQFGGGLTPRLVRTGTSGAANVAAQTGQAFGTTVERWALANWVSDLPGFTAPAELRYTTWHFRRTYASLNLQDPVDFPTPFPLVPIVSSGTPVSRSGFLRAGSGAYLRVIQPPGGPGQAFALNAGTSAPPASLEPRFTVVRIR